MEPLSTVGAGLAVLGSKDILTKILGPTADYIGGELQQFVEKCNINLDHIFVRAIERLGDKIDDPGQIHPRVLKHVLDDGRFCEDELTADYYGGLLASARTEAGSDDRVVPLLHTLSQLSTYQIRFHYILYCLIKQVFGENGKTSNIHWSGVRERISIFIPFDETFMGIGIESIENTKEAFRSTEAILVQCISGLKSLSLIDSASWGTVDELVKRGYSKASEGGVIITPSVYGAELAFWVNGHRDIPSKFFLSEQFKLTMLPELYMPKKAMPASSLLDD